MIAWLRRLFGWCENGWFHDWEYNKGKYIRVCKKCAKRHIWTTPDMPFGRSGWIER
jgi:hypothetical protein